MNRSGLLLLLALAMLSTGCSFSQDRSAAVTYSLNGNRFGDDLVSYCHARWISCKYHIPFYYRPFHYSNELQLHTAHPHIENAGSFERTITYPTWPEMGEKMNHFDIEKNTLYIIPYFPETIEEAERLRLWHFDDTGWDEKEFISLLRKEISPLAPLELVRLPRGRQCVAVHVRKGGGFDRLYQTSSTIKRGTINADLLAPLKFPPDSFYVEYIKKVSEQFWNEPLYVHIFTDDSDPQALVDYYESQVGKPNIIYGCRQEGNSHDKNVLEDFFSLMQFDVMIRPESNYSIMASKLGKYKMVISPANFKWNGTELVITGAHVESNMHASLNPS